MKGGSLIFNEPPANVDETWTHGAMLGGMCGFDDESLARSYFLAGSALIERTLSTGERGQEIICPVLYVYRHGIELYLKVIVRPANLDHSLGSLLNAFCCHVRDRYNERAPAWITRPITQLAEFDPGSDLFRYGTTKPPSRSQRLQDAGEFWVDLRSLQQTMLNIERAFTRVIIADAHGLDAIRHMEVARLA